MACFSGSGLSGSSGVEGRAVFLLAGWSGGRGGLSNLVLCSISFFNRPLLLSDESKSCALHQERGSIESPCLSGIGVSHCDVPADVLNRLAMTARAA